MAEVKWLPYRPSNGTEGDIFISEWCERCQRDRAYQESGGNEPGCEIVARTFFLDLKDPDYPKEWRRREDATVWPGAECTAFEPYREAPEESHSIAVRDELTQDLFPS